MASGRVEISGNFKPPLFHRFRAAADSEREVLVITPQSPLGGQLQGRKQDDRLELMLGGKLRKVHVVSVG